MDDMTRMLLSRIAGDGAEIPALSLPDMVEQSLGEDPIAAPLAAALRRRAERASEVVEVEPAQPGPPEVSVLADPELADLLERIYAELEVMRERNTTLADALGACPRCWGEDQLCELCRGRGRPGGRSPDAVLFAEFVEPARRRLGVPAAGVRTIASLQAHQPQEDSYA
jgi:hypothetical protein